MSLTKAQLREILTEAGVDAELIGTAVNKIISGHTASIEALRDEVNSLREDVAKYKTDAEKLPGLKEELKSAKAEAEKHKDKDYDALKAEYDSYKAEISAKEVKAQKEKLYREALRDADLSDSGIEKAIKYADWDAIEIDDKGALKDAKSIVKSARDEWAAYVVKKETQGAEVSNPPGNGGSGKPVLSNAARMAQQYYSEHYGGTTTGKEA